MNYEDWLELTTLVPDLQKDCVRDQLLNGIRNVKGQEEIIKLFPTNNISLKKILILNLKSGEIQGINIT